MNIIMRLLSISIVGESRLVSLDPQPKHCSLTFPRAYFKASIHSVYV